MADMLPCHLLQLQNVLNTLAGPGTGGTGGVNPPGAPGLAGALSGLTGSSTGDVGSAGLTNVVGTVTGALGGSSTGTPPVASTARAYWLGRMSARCCQTPTRRPRGRSSAR